MKTIIQGLPPQQEPVLIPGPPGPQGPRGIKWFVSASDPLPDQFADARENDLCLNTATGDVFQFVVFNSSSLQQLRDQIRKAKNVTAPRKALPVEPAWVLVGNIIGPAGIAEIPDPLPVATQLNLGNDARLVATVDGMEIQIKNSSGEWVAQAFWILPLEP